MTVLMLRTSHPRLGAEEVLETYVELQEIERRFRVVTLVLKRRPTCHWATVGWRCMSSVFVDGGWVLVMPDPDLPYYYIVASVDEPTEALALAERSAVLVQSALGSGKAPEPVKTSLLVPLPSRGTGARICCE